MEAVILAGGQGTRLRPYTVILPKPLVPVGEHPILEIMLHQLKTAGVKKVTIAVNHMADLIMAFFGNGDKFGISINYSMEEKPLSTVAPIKLIKDLPENFFVLNGDILTDIDYAKLYESHIQSGASITVATYTRKVKIDFGVLQLDENNKTITGFQEKPIHTYDVSMGIYVFQRSLLKKVPANQPYGFDNLMLDLLKNGQEINAFPYQGYWLDIGRPDDYEQANEEFANLKERFYK
ncbi:MAG: sugar phosphate nucleotidyltransferase [Candidatus Xenobiia bacterium LiM19]